MSHRTNVLRARRSTHLHVVVEVFVFPIMTVASELPHFKAQLLILGALTKADLVVDRTVSFVPGVCTKCIEGYKHSLPSLPNTHCVFSKRPPRTVHVEPIDVSFRFVFK